MTKRDILDKLMMLNYCIRGEEKSYREKSDDPYDYYTGYANACEKYSNKIDALYQELTNELKYKSK